MNEKADDIYNEVFGTLEKHLQGDESASIELYNYKQKDGKKKAVASHFNGFKLWMERDDEIIAEDDREKYDNLFGRNYVVSKEHQNFIEQIEEEMKMRGISRLEVEEDGSFSMDVEGKF